MALDGFRISGAGFDPVGWKGLFDLCGKPGGGAFCEKDLEGLALEGIIALFVYGLCHFGVVTSDQRP